MKLSDLVKKAAALPDLDFEWPGPEQYSDMNFAAETADHAHLVRYVDNLRKRMAEQSIAIHHLKEAYIALREIVLEAEISHPSK